MAKIKIDAEIVDDQVKVVMGTDDIGNFELAKIGACIAWQVRHLLLEAPEG